MDAEQKAEQKVDERVDERIDEREIQQTVEQVRKIMDEAEEAKKQIEEKWEELIPNLSRSKWSQPCYAVLYDALEVMELQPEINLHRGEKKEAFGIEKGYNGKMMFSWRPYRGKSVEEMPIQIMMLLPENEFARYLLALENHAYTQGKLQEMKRLTKAIRELKEIDDFVQKYKKTKYRFMVPPSARVEKEEHNIRQRLDDADSDAVWKEEKNCCVSLIEYGKTELKYIEISDEYVICETENVEEFKGLSASARNETFVIMGSKYSYKGGRAGTLQQFDWAVFMVRMQEKIVEAIEETEKKVEEQQRVWKEKEVELRERFADVIVKKAVKQMNQTEDE